MPAYLEVEWYEGMCVRVYVAAFQEEQDYQTTAFEEMRKGRSRPLVSMLWGSDGGGPR